MLSHRERLKLMKDMNNEPLFAAGILIKCGAGLLTIAGLAWIGATADAPDYNVGRPSTPVNAVAITASTGTGLSNALQEVRGTAQPDIGAGRR